MSVNGVELISALTASRDSDPCSIIPFAWISRDASKAYQMNLFV